eukprot:1159566-Pelagomonas_calceolata.AAC.29
MAVRWVCPVPDSAFPCLGKEGQASPIFSVTCKLPHLVHSIYRSLLVIILSLDFVCPRRQALEEVRSTQMLTATAEKGILDALATLQSSAKQTV